VFLGIVLHVFYFIVSAIIVLRTKKRLSAGSLPHTPLPPTPPSADAVPLYLMSSQRGFCNHLALRAAVLNQWNGRHLEQTLQVTNGMADTESKLYM
jgi:hypothetical protein